MRAICDHCEKDLNLVYEQLRLVYWCMPCVKKDKKLLRDTGRLLYITDDAVDSIDIYATRFLSWSWDKHIELLRTIPKLKRYRIRRLKCLEKI